MRQEKQGPNRRHLALLATLVVGIVAGVGNPVSTAQRRPVIERIEPAAGPVGSRVDVLGRFFPDTATVKLGATNLTVLDRRPGRWTVEIPAGAESGRILLETSFGGFVGPAFRVTEANPKPVIRSVNPSDGPPGTEVNIGGDNFSARLADNHVRIGDKTAIVTAATPNSLKAIVPSGATSGPITVAVDEAGEAKGGKFTVTAATVVGKFTPVLGPPGTEVTISGEGFAKEPGQNRVFLNGVRVPVKSSSPTALVVEIPKKAASGKFLVDVNDGGRAETADAFSLMYPPEVTKMIPVAAAPGASVSVVGKHFGSDVRVVSVTLNGKPVTVRAVSPTEIEVDVPSDAATGRFEVTVNGLGPAKTPVDFIVRSAVVVTGFRPASGPVGTTVTLVGKGFAPGLLDNRVKMGGASAAIVTASETQLTVAVPKDAVTSVFEVTVTESGKAASAQPFVVTKPPSITAFEPTEGEPDTVITIRGHNLGESEDLAEVTLAGTKLDIVSVSPEQIVAVVGKAAQSGRISVRVAMQGLATTQRGFRVIPPPEGLALTSVEPECDHAGCKVVLRGHGFHEKLSDNQVLFGSTPVTVLDSSKKALTITLPKVPGSQPFKVIVKDAGEAVSAPFTITK